MKSSVSFFLLTVCFSMLSAEASFSAVPCKIAKFDVQDSYEKVYAVVNEDTDQLIIGDNTVNSAHVELQDAYHLYSELIATGQCVKARKTADCEIKLTGKYYFIGIGELRSKLEDRGIDWAIADFNVYVQTGQCRPTAIPRKCNIDARCESPLGYPYRIFSPEDNTLIMGCYRNRDDVIHVVRQLRAIGQCVPN
jgi:hypothetical protein